jgi:hypothetical protein
MKNEIGLEQKESLFSHPAVSFLAENKIFLRDLRGM